MIGNDARDRLITVAHALYARGLTHGRTGNLSLRCPEGFWVTPTGSSLGTLRAGDLSLVDRDGTLLAGPTPSKETFLHAAVLRARPDLNAVVHTHSTHSAAVSCLADLDEHDALPPLTPYYVMRVGRLPVLPYFAPGDQGSGPLAEALARQSHALLLRNHGPVVGGIGLDEAVEALEEIEETARLHLLLHGLPTRVLSDAERQAVLLRTQAKPRQETP